MALVDFAGLGITLPVDWADVTESLEDPTPTLARMDGGIGALQVSVAYAPGGPLAEFDEDALQALLRDFAATQGWTVGTIHSETLPRPLVWADFDQEGEAIRVWYVAKGPDLAFWTFVSLKPDAPATQQELADADAIVRSTRFKPGR